MAVKKEVKVSSIQIPVYRVEVVAINVSGELAPPTQGVYYASTGSSLEFELNIVDESGHIQTQIDNLGLSYPPLKIPMLKIAEGGKGNIVGEVYVNATLEGGVLRGSFSAFPSSGNWQINMDRINDSLKVINANWRIEAENFIFLV